MNTPLVTIIVPSWDNPEYLRPCITSLLRNQATPGLFEILVINNGHPNSCDYLKGVKQVKLINAGRNLGWEGGIDLGLKNSTSPFVCFFNDDAYIPQSSRLWLNQLLQHFKNPQVGAVGPSSGVVMGAQNIFADIPYITFKSTFIIGFCALIRRSAFEKIGGMDFELPGGDDLDWSIRLRKAGYDVMIDRSVFVYHHGFKTGERVYGNPNSPSGWNSFEKTEKTNLALIKKHGLKTWWETMRNQIIEGDKVKYSYDTEGKTIRKLIKKTDKDILDLGCGPRKTIKRAVGIDIVPRGQQIPTLDENINPVYSDADMTGDVSSNIPVPDNSQDVIIGRHILEHFIDHIAVLDHWISKLKPNGRLILALPNEEWHQTIPMNSEHQHSFTPKSTLTLLQGMGLTNIGYYTSGNNVSFIVEGYKNGNS